MAHRGRRRRYHLRIGDYGTGARTRTHDQYVTDNIDEYARYRLKETLILCVTLVETLLYLIQIINPLIDVRMR